MRITDEVERDFGGEVEGLRNRTQGQPMGIM